MLQLQRLPPRLPQVVQIHRRSLQRSCPSHAVGGASGVGGAGASADMSLSVTAAPWSGHRKLCTAVVGMLAGLSGLAASFFPSPGSTDEPIAKGTRRLPVFAVPTKPASA